MQSGAAHAVRVVLWRVVLVLAGLELIYLLAANLVVRSDLIKSAVAGAEGFGLEYGRAYTLWPGHVHVEDFALRVEDYNVQFQVELDRAELDIALSELLFKKFHVTRLDAQGTSFRMRHKLITVGADAERVAAYPPIEGFADPPYYVGVRPPSFPDDDLWSVRIDNVTAHTDELWVLEHRFRGQATARGSFVVAPTRWVQVSAATLDIERGKLELGEHLVAASVKGRIRCDVPDMDVQATEGSQVFREISSHIALELDGGKLDFLRAYLARFGPLHYSGKGAWHLDLRVQSGVVQEGSSVSLLAKPLVVSRGDLGVSGDVMLSLVRRDDAGPEGLALAFNAPELLAHRSGPAKNDSPRLRGLRGSLSLRAADLAGEMRVGAGRLAAEELAIPDLGWLRLARTQLGGSLRAKAQLQRDERGYLSGHAELWATDAAFARDDVRLTGALASQVSLAPSKPAALALREARLELRAFQIRSGERHSQRFDATVQSPRLELRSGTTPTLRGSLAASVSSTEALLPLFVGSVVRDVGAEALALRRLTGQADLKLSPERVALRRISLQSGRLRMRGHLEQRESQAAGAMLLSSGPLNVGVTLEDGTTRVSPFVGDDWLAPPRS